MTRKLAPPPEAGQALVVVVPPQTAVVLPVALNSAIATWAASTTDSTSPIRADLLRNKARDVRAFFGWVDKPPQSVTPADVDAYRNYLVGLGYSAASIYAMLSRVSSLYRWAQRDPVLAKQLPVNPVNLARPKTPRQYDSESTKSLDDEQVRDLLRLVKKGRGLTAKRDYALLMFYFLTGMRRQEIAALKRGDVEISGQSLRFTARVKGGALKTVELKHSSARSALLRYVKASGREWVKMKPTERLWLRHDSGATGDRAEAGVTSWGIAKSLKRYCATLGFTFHLHQTRHTFARIVADESGSLLATQEALGHAHASTTRVYVQRVGVSKDKYSDSVAERLGVK